jgi:hypothetical protein
MHRAAEREERKEERKSEFKKGVTGDEATSHRIEQHETIRKARRDQHLKRIRKGDEGETKTFTAAEARDIMIGLQTGSSQNRSLFLKKLVLLTSSDDPQLLTLHQMQVVAVLQKIITGSHTHDQFEALLCLTNLALNDHNSTMMLYPALPYVVHLLAADNHQMAEQAAWSVFFFFLFSFSHLFYSLPGVWEMWLVIQMLSCVYFFVKIITPKGIAMNAKRGSLWLGQLILSCCCCVSTTLLRLFSSLSALQSPI